MDNLLVRKKDFRVEFADTKAKKLLTTALLIIIGLVLPMFTHMFGAGNIILPMHIPVLLAGLLLPIPYAATVACATPILSCLLTGMPPLMPMLPIMLAELAVYSLIANLTYQRLRLNVYISLPLTMLAGRLAAALVVYMLIELFAVQLAPPFVYLATAVTVGIPGIIIQIIVIPPVVFALNRIARKRIGYVT